jgi:hypothetical protein
MAPPPFHFHPSEGGKRYSEIPLEGSTALGLQPLNPTFVECHSLVVLILSFIVVQFPPKMPGIFPLNSESLSVAD